MSLFFFIIVRQGSRLNRASSFPFFVYFEVFEQTQRIVELFLNKVPLLWEFKRLLTALKTKLTSLKCVTSVAGSLSNWKIDWSGLMNLRFRREIRETITFELRQIYNWRWRWLVRGAMPFRWRISPGIKLIRQSKRRSKGWTIFYFLEVYFCW